jgi:putative Mn2+ efflux pump MntP
MELFEMLLIAAGLSMDAFAVAICKGLSTQQVKFRHSIITGLFFGGFQAFMPLAGYLLASQFSGYVTAISHWIAFILLSAIGINMIRESRSSHCEHVGNAFSFKSMVVLSVATSIDALAVGVTFAFMQVRIIPAILIIGVTTFIFSAVGVRIGKLFGEMFRSRAEFAGGLILIAIGIKILLEHI